MGQKRKLCPVVAMGPKNIIYRQVLAVGWLVIICYCQGILGFV
jgi:hypothetical protein